MCFQHIANKQMQVETEKQQLDVFIHENQDQLGKLVWLLNCIQTNNIQLEI